MDNPSYEPRLEYSPQKCLARSKHGANCPNFARKNGRCRRHGGLSTGPKTLAGLARSRHANWQHGDYSAEAKLMRFLGSRILAETQETITEMLDRTT